MDDFNPKKVNDVVPKKFKVLGVVGLLVIAIVATAFFVPDFGIQGFLKKKVKLNSNVTTTASTNVNLGYAGECVASGDRVFGYVFDNYSNTPSDYNDYALMYADLKAEIIANDGSSKCPYLVRFPLRNAIDAPAEQMGKVVCKNFVITDSALQCNVI